jgi:hypothetical protein
MAGEENATTGRGGTSLPKELKVMIAIPAYGRSVYVTCAMGLANLVGVFAARRVPYRMHSLSDAVIARARNAMAAEFLADDRGWTHLVMIDSDVGFNPRDILRMIAFNKDIVGCALPKRQYDTTALPEAGVKNWAEAEAYMSTFTADIPLQDGRMQSIGGFVQARHVATAVMVVKRQVFETMIEKKAAPKITPDIPLAPGRVENYYGFFEPIIDPKTHAYLAEDFSFCRRWREQCGGEIWCDIQGEYVHTGTHDFKGNLFRTLQARGARAEVKQPDGNG